MRKRLAGRQTRACLLALLVAAGLSLLAWKVRASILRSAAHLWAVSDTLAPADAVVVLGGSDERPGAAAQLYRSGMADRILIDEDDNLKSLLNLNVPPQAVAAFGSGLKNTYEEACALAAWAGKNGTRRIIIPIELFSSRRVRWIFARELRGRGASVMIDVIPIPGNTADNWWSSVAGRDQFLIEIEKYFYYRVRYFFDHC